MMKRIPSLLAATALTAIGNVAHAQTSPSPYTAATRYDAAGRVTGTISPNDAARGYPNHLATRTTYDTAGRPIKVESGYLTSWQSEAVAPASWPTWTGSAGFLIQTTVETTYNAQNQKLTERVKGYDGVPYTLTQYSYDAAGRLECTAVRMNPAAYGSLPASACTLGTQGSDGPDRITRNIYDAAGQLVQVREGVGAGSTIEAAEVTYSYTLNGKIEYVVDAGGHKALKCYDAFDRQSRWVFPSTTNPGSFNDSTAASALSTAGAANGACTGATGDYEEYVYDANGNRTSLRKRDGQTLTYQYDLLNRNTVKVVPGSTTHTRDVYYTYDLRGLMTAARFDSTSGEGVTIAYDGFGRKTTETLAMDGVSRTLTSQFDANGNRTRLTWPDGSYINYYRDGLNRLYYSDNGVIPTFYTPFDSVSRLAAIYPWNPAVGWDNPTGFSYDYISRLSAHVLYLAGTSYDSTTTFTYNPASQKTSVSRSNDVYAFAGYANVNRGYTANGLNQYSSVGGTGFAYDSNGNLTSDGTNGFTYDVENRLVTRTGGASATLRYDPLGRLYEASGAGGTRRFVYDGDALVAEYNGSNVLLRSYVHGTSTGDDPLVWFEGSGVSTTMPRYLYSDERGSIVAVTDSGGNVTNINTYDEYGIPASGNAGAFQYTGQVWLPELGMYYYKARIYSPTLGRFMQVDPIGYDDQINLYAYSGNDAVNAIDPSGMATVYGDTKTGSILRAKVEVDADFNNDGKDDLSQSQLNSIGKDFAGFISAHDGQDISSAGKNISGDGSITDKTFTRVVSQFVGASGLARGWDKIDQIDVSARDYWKWGEDASYGERQDGSGRGVIFITGSPAGWGGRYLYDSPSNMARALFHEAGHTPHGIETDHAYVDTLARRQLQNSGLGGGGCWRYGPLGEGFPGC